MRSLFRFLLNHLSALSCIGRSGHTIYIRAFHQLFQDAELTKLACEAAKRHGVTVSVDLNFRKKLWTSEKAISVMRPLMKYVDVCIGNEEDAQLCLGFKPDADVEGGKTDAEGYYGIFKGMMKEFVFKYVVSTLRESLSATHNGWKALIYDGQIIKNGCLWRFITKNAN